MMLKARSSGLSEAARSEAGAGMAEYTLLLLLIAVPLALIFPSLAAAIATALANAAAAF